MTRDRVTIAPSASTRATRDAIVERARRRGFTRFADDADHPIEAGAEEEVVRRGDGELATRGGRGAPIPLAVVGDPEALDRAVRGAPTGSTLAVEWTGDRVIPLENAIAAVAGRVELWVYARGPHEVPGALGALERGAQRIIVVVRSPEEVDAVESLLEATVPTHLDWVVVPVRSVRPAGLGDRVLVDTTSILDPAEGLLVGSSAAFLFHVASEAVGSKFSGPRAFRVNAGAAHSYVLMADGSTRYLSELGPGDAVLGCRPTGPTRSVRVGRIKIERRPLVVVTSSIDGVDRTIFLQEAETVRLSSKSGRVPTTDLPVGTPVDGVKLAPARHLGQPIEETIIER